MSRLSVSFLVDEMRRVPGGCAPNIAYGLALLGERPAALRHGRPRRGRVPRAPGRARASTSPGLRARAGRLHGVVLRLDRPGPEPDRLVLHGSDGAGARAIRSTRSTRPTIAFVVISPNDPPAMARYAEECREREHPVPLRPEPAGGAPVRRGDARGLAGRRDPDRQRLRVRDPDAEDGAVARGHRARGSGPDRHARCRRVDDPRSARAAAGSSTTIPPAKRRERRRSTRRASATRTGPACCAGCGSGRPGPWPGRMGSVAAVFGLETPGPAAAALLARTSSARATSATSARPPELDRLFA